MPRGSGRGGNGRDRGEGDSGRNREEENTERSREDKDEIPGGFKIEQPPEGDSPDISVSSGDLSISGDVYKNTGDGASEIGARTETSYGPVKVVNEIGARAEHQWSDGKLQLGADVEVKTEHSIGIVTSGANARASAGIHSDLDGGRFQIGAEASANAELKLGNKDETGNELALGAGVGWGGGFEGIWGADADGDGQKEYGTSVSVKLGIGLDIGFRVEPEAVTNRVRDLLGISKGGREVPREEETHNCAERIHELLSSQK